MRNWLGLPLRDWSQLPDDVILLILSRTNAVEDLIIFSAVCRSWRSVAVKEYSTRRIQLPWLMLGENHGAETRGFFSLYSKKHYNVMLPNMSGRRIWGSLYGWLLVLEFDRQFFLFNPVTRVRLDLPPKPIFRGEVDHDDRQNHAASVPGFVRKAFVLKCGSGSSIHQDRFLVVAVGNVSGNLAFAKPGGRNWIQIRTPFGRIESAAWCNDRLFAIMDTGDLFLVLRFFSEENRKNWHKTKYFDVYKLEFEKKEWVKVHELGDRALFIDADNYAMSLSTSEVKDCKGSCIYFVEKYWNKWGRYLGSNDVGIFSVVDRGIETHFISDAFSSCAIRPNPIWVMPSLC
ncbi:hypothetical protein Vadar_031599 [Vaccinium darrowii]|uniref:Uncharacterized protein n=1 Tax=Vaccinium darrowii TaxID=229202 RepID=A0ACB7XDH8_9ERIC|nr:hypothetical protein Vadar_031599 [Vaccinium darrowii]